MAIKKFKPIPMSRRFQEVIDYKQEITTDEPYKPLLQPKKRISGRNNYGHITVRHRGGGSKKQYRVIDFKREKAGIPARVETIEYDPNRSAFIALLSYADGEKSYILQPVGLKVGMKVVSGPEADILVGNALPLKNIPLGTTIHNIEMRPGKGAQMVRAAGGSASWLRRKASMLMSSCHRAKFDLSVSIAKQPWGGWATWITRRLPSEKRDVSAIVVSDRRCVAW